MVHWTFNSICRAMIHLGPVEPLGKLLADSFAFLNINNKKTEMPDKYQERREIITVATSKKKMGHLQQY